MTDQEPSDGAPDPAVVAIGRAVERVARRIDVLDKAVRSLAGDLAELSAAPPASAEGADSESVGTRSWLLTDDAEQAVADLAELIAWVDRVYLRFSRAVLSTCWLWHPEVVEELWWLRCAHADAYHPKTGSWLRVGDWHDRQRPGVQARLNSVLTKCSLSRHVERNGRPADVTDPAPAPLAGHHAAVALAWAQHHQVGPTPSPELLAEAARHDDTRHRGGR